MPVLLEGELAKKWLKGISAIDFFTIEARRHEVYETLFENLHFTYFFTIESFRLGNSSEPEVAYKIVDLVQTASFI